MADKVEKTETPAINAFVEATPQIMHELTTAFKAMPDLNARSKIRARMKNILDFLSVDTSYPGVGTGKPHRGNMFDIPQYNPADGDVGDQPVGVHPIPGAENPV